MPPFPIDQVRAAFPAVARSSRVFFDGPGGTQVCGRAIDAMAGYLQSGTANSGGAFATSRETDATSAAAHDAMADLIHADAQDIAFGPNMTTLTLAASRALARTWEAGDEVVVTRLDHDANVAPWLLAARDAGATVRWIDFDPETGVLDLDALPGLLGKRTRLVAVGAASNALGTLNDVAAIARIVKANSDALVAVDAVQSVPHVPTDVTALGCDLLTCSPYKFFGPHMGVVWARREAFAGLETYKVRPASAEPPVHGLETGTPSFEAQAALVGTIDHLDWLGSQVAAGEGRPARLHAAMRWCQDYEAALSAQLLDGLRTIPGLRLWGVQGVEGRVPTFGVTIAGHDPHALAAQLARRDICVWSGHFYAVEVIARLGLADSGGLLRIGLCHYNSAEEIDRLIGELREIAG